jgi:hypothetical protein
MPVKNIIPGQRVTKEKLQRAKELRREMTPAENFYGRKSARRSWESGLDDSRLFRGSSSIFTVTPSAFGTHLSLRSGAKYDKKKSECGIKLYIVGFG